MKLLERVGRAWHKEAHEDVDHFESCQAGFCPAVRKELEADAKRAFVLPDGTVEVETMDAAVRLSAERIAGAAAGVTAAAKLLGARGGKLGGETRMRVLTPERRREIATKAARTRWGR